MSIQLTVPPKRELKPRIVVVGVGGAGGNAVNNMISAGLEGVDFVVANTDAQALAASQCERRIQMGSKLTEGLGAGSNPEVGQGAAEESMAEIVDVLQGSHMAFITAGMGGGTGTGAAPMIARAARDAGILTVGVVTKPFEFEGNRRMRSAVEGINRLAQEVDTLIIIPNQNLFRIANAQTTFAEAFALADEVLHSGVAGITDLMIQPGLINLDFADVRTVMNEMGKAMMGTGEAGGDNRAVEAAEAAIANPLLDDVSMRGARGVLINISGGDDMTLYEVDEAANRIREEVDPEANIIIGSTFDVALQGAMRVSVVATGIEAAAAREPVASDDVANVIAMNPSVNSGPVPVEPADMTGQIAQPGVEAPLPGPMTVTPEFNDAHASGAADAPTEPAPPGAGELPGFLREKSLPPPRRDVPKRSRSFLQRVFGGREESAGQNTDNGPSGDTKAQMAVAANGQMAMQQPQGALNVAVAETQPEIAVEPVAEQTPAEMPTEMPMEPTQEPQPAPAARRRAPSTSAVQAGSVDDSALAMPRINADESVSNNADLLQPKKLGRNEPIEPVEPPSAGFNLGISDDAPIAPAAQAPVSEDKPARPATADSQTSMPLAAPDGMAASTGASGATKSDPVQSGNSAPILQTSMQTQINVGGSYSGPSYDSDQLDIPAFLRR